MVWILIASLAAICIVFAWLHLRTSKDFSVMSYVVCQLEREVFRLHINLKAIHDAGPVGCKVCGSHRFVEDDEVWVCKECRHPAPESFVDQISPEERTIN